jgi:hypothetical protein
MAGNFSRTDSAFAKVISEMTDAELESTARDYIWLAEFGPTARFPTFQPQRDAVVRECERRCCLALLVRIRNGFPRSSIE